MIENPKQVFKGDHIDWPLLVMLMIVYAIILCIGVFMPGQVF
jgi:hypothetical protein